MSESKKTSSPYAVLENRSLDQWKVTELKEELKRRKLTTKGLKDDLVRRLDEAVRAEVEEPNENHDNGVNDIISQPSDDATIEPLVAEKKTTSITDDSGANNESLAEDNKITEKFDINESLENNNLAEKMVTGDENLKKDSSAEKLDNNDQSSKEQNKTENLENEGLQPSAKKLVAEGQHRDLENVEINNEEKVSNLQAEEEVKPNSFPIGDQVDEVSQVKSDSISIDTMSITEKNELKDNVIITDDVKLELDVKPEMVHPSSSSKLVLDGGAKTESVVSDEEKDVNNGESVNICKKINSEDVGSPEKLNLDRSSGDDSMEEDALESKQIDSKFSSEDIGDDVSKKTEVALVKEDEVFDVMVEDTPAASKSTESIKENSDPSSVVPTKRKLHDQEAVANSEVVKRQRRWNSEGLKVPPEQQHTTNPSVSTTPKDAMFQGSMKHSFSRSNSSVSHEEPKERVVPPSSKAATTSLRIDRFLRPFTLKAVQELLGKTGTVVSFWMDHIKTHCYVTYSSVEEAVETRNAVYNLQWPTNGGRLLVAEFVDPLEVKTRTEVPPPPSPLTPANATTPTLLPQPPQQLPPPPPLLPPPPPPPLSFPPQLREPALPPPPPLHEKTDPPIVTLDDLFRKTRATPRIYYLPLSDEQVAAKGQGKAAAKQ